MIYVRHILLEPKSQYRWFLVIYQMGVFSSRSLGNCLKPRSTWWATIVQFGNAGFFAYTASTLQAPWIVFIFVFVVGFIGGLCYVHTFQRLIRELPTHQQKFSLGMMTFAESFGIAFGGILGMIRKYRFHSFWVTIKFE